MKTQFVLSFILFFMVNNLSSQPLGIFPERNGSRFSFDENAELYTFSSGVQSLYREAAEKCLLTARIAELSSKNEAGLRFFIPDDNINKAYSLSAKSVSSGSTSIELRQGNKTIASKNIAGSSEGLFLRLERDAYTLVASYASQDKVMGELASISLGDDDFFSIGLQANGKASFSHVRYSQTGALLQSTAGIESRLEVMDIEKGTRKVVYKAESHFEAPNWSPEGDYLLFNSEGLLYRYYFDSRAIEELPTDFANACNNDHGISPDGKRLVISHHQPGLGRGRSSTIYTLPISGGTPIQITPNSPSYWHGWSPDGKELAFVGLRDDAYNIYSIPADGRGPEKQLTFTPGLDDGPDYSPDGKYIYFNSERSGTMCIWRMTATGLNAEQLTFDAYQDWFAHPSPDGKWIVFVSYEPIIPSADHPPMKKVMLRIMPTDLSSEPKVLTHLFGGQGTINVPSWSPDSKKFAFVSYSVVD